jgi:hypothetical protein
MKELTFTIKIESWEDIPDDQAEEVVKALTQNLASAVNRQIDESDEGLFGNDNMHCTRGFTVSSNELNHEVFVNKES